MNLAIVPLNRRGVRAPGHAWLTFWKPSLMIAAILLSSGQKQLSQAEEPVHLLTRTINFNPLVFEHGLGVGKAAGVSNAAPEFRRVLLQFLSDLGMSLEPPKSIYCKRGTWIVHATQQELDTIEAAIRAVDIPAPNVNFRVTVVEMPERLEISGAVQNNLRLTQSGPKRGQPLDTNAVLAGVLDEKQALAVMQTLKSSPAVTIVSDTSVNTVNAHRTQIRLTQLQGADPTPLCGLTLDVVGYAAEDTHSMETVLIPTFVEPLDHVETETASTSRASFFGPGPYRARMHQMTVSGVIQDGETIVLGDSDKLPFSMHALAKPDWLRKTTLMFITPTLVDPSGNRVRRAPELQSKPR